MKDSEQLNQKLVEVSELKQAMLSEVRDIAKLKKLPVGEDIDTQSAVDIAVNLNYYRRVFEHGLGMILWYISTITEHGDYQKIIQDQVGISLPKARRLKRRAKFFFKYPSDFVKQLSGSKKDFLMRLPEGMLEGLEDEEGTLGDIEKGDIIRMPVKELEGRIKEAVDGTTVALQQELETKSVVMDEMGKELAKLRSDNARLRDPQGRDTEKEAAITKYASDLEVAAIHFIQFLEGSPVPEGLKELTTAWMQRFDRHLDSLRPKLVDLAFPDKQGWQPDRDVLNRVDSLYTPNGSDDEAAND